MSQLCDCCERPLGEATAACPHCGVKFAQQPAVDPVRQRAEQLAFKLMGFIYSAADVDQIEAALRAERTALRAQVEQKYKGAKEDRQNARRLKDIDGDAYHEGEADAFGHVLALLEQLGGQR